MTECEYSVINLEVCDIKPFDDVFRNTEKTVEDVEKALKDTMAVSDPCVVLVEGEEEDGVKSFFFVYFNIAAAPTKETFVGGSTVASRMSSGLKSRYLDNARVLLFNKIQVISYCYDALPLIKDKIMRKYCLPESSPAPLAPFPDMPDSDADKEKYLGKMDGLEKKVESISDPKDVPEADKAVAEQICFILGYVAKYVKSIPELKKFPYPGPSPLKESSSSGSSTSAPAGPELEKLKKQLAEKEKMIEDIKSMMTGTLKIQGPLSDAKMMEELKKLVEKNKPRAPFFSDPGVKGKEMTFTPQNFIYDFAGKKEERVVFINHPSTYRYFFILNDDVKRLGLDPTKPVTCVIVDTTHHCSTDQPAETPFTKEYNMPKGEDYYLCSIKDYKQ